MLLKKNLWCSSTIITLRSGGSKCQQNKIKSPMTQPTSKRHQPIVYGHNNSGSHGKFGASGSKGIPNTKGSWGQPKNAKADFNGSSKSITFDKHLKR